MASRDELRKRVEAGAALLDAKGPANWRKLLVGIRPLDTHEMYQLEGEIGKCGCPITRTVNRSWFDGLTDLGIRYYEASDYGLDISEGESQFAILAELWNEEAQRDAT